MTNKTLVQINKSVKFSPVTGSSLIESYAREAGDLALKFSGGSTYIYKGVDDNTMNDFLAASSKGKFFATSIKNKFAVEQAE